VKIIKSNTYVGIEIAKAYSLYFSFDKGTYPLKNLIPKKEVLGVDNPRIYYSWYRFDFVINKCYLGKSEG
jgi:hypothetical protein